ncbi:MAG: class I SAM-dependent methyltransferase [Arenimonas sp.]
MKVEVSSARTKIRNWLRPLLQTPFHPQWFMAKRGVQKLAWVKRHSKGRTLDVGCADGAMASILSPDCDYVGLDYPETALKLYRTKPSVFGDAAQLPLASGSFDTVMLLDTLEHVALPDAAMMEACRVLKQEGLLMITIPFAYPVHDAPHDFQRFTQFGLRSRAKNAGFEIIEISSIGSGMEAGALSACVSLAQASIETFSRRSWRMVFVPIAVFAIPVINIFAWLLSKALPENQMQPLAYYMLAVKRTVHENVSKES